MQSVRRACAFTVRSCAQNRSQQISQSHLHLTRLYLLPDGTGNCAQTAFVSFNNPFKYGISLWTARHILRRASSTAGGAADSSETSGFISENEIIGNVALDSVSGTNRRTAGAQSVVYDIKEWRRPRV